MQVQNKHDKGTQTAQLAPHASCSLAQIIVNNYDKHMTRILLMLMMGRFLHNLRKPYVYSSKGNSSCSYRAGLSRLGSG